MTDEVERWAHVGAEWNFPESKIHDSASSLGCRHSDSRAITVQHQSIQSGLFNVQLELR